MYNRFAENKLDILLSSLKLYDKRYIIIIMCTLLTKRQVEIKCSVASLRNGRCSTFTKFPTPVYSLHSHTQDDFF